jgi:hypothetical protein
MRLVGGIGMTSRLRQIGVRGFAAAAPATVAACAVFLGSALAQEARPPAEIPSQNARAGAANPPAESAPLPRPGFVDAIGSWLDEGTTKFKSGLQGAQHSFDQFADQTRDAAKDATGAVMGLPNTRIVPVRERCAVVGDVGPDCQAAATTACRGKGFSTGKSLDTQSAQKCPAQVLLRGRAPSDGECPTETFVTRALCQ